MNSSITKRYLKLSNMQRKTKTISNLSTVFSKRQDREKQQTEQSVRALLTERLPYFLPVIFLKKSKKCTGWQRKSSLPFTVTVS